MAILLNWRVWAALVLAVMMAGASFTSYRAGKANVRGQWDAAKVVQLAGAARAEAKNRDTEQKLRDTVIEAQNDAIARTHSLQVVAANARAESERLRDNLTAITARLPGLTRDAVDNYAATATTVLDDCQRKYQELAATADGHASDTQTLMQAWPHAVR